jgi:hypothetical protein
MPVVISEELHMFTFLQTSTRKLNDEKLRNFCLSSNIKLCCPGLSLNKDAHLEEATG